MEEMKNLGDFPSRFFSSADQIWFAHLSGDWNPIHVDPIQARRTQYGQVVHGIHVLMWALNSFFERVEVKSLSKLKVLFIHPVHLSDEVTIVQKEKGSEFLLEIYNQSKVLISIELALSEEIFSDDCPLSSKKNSHIPDQHSFSDLSSFEGVEEIGADSFVLQEKFPHLVHAIGNLRVAALLGLSRLVGMRCPGLNSIFSGLEVFFVSQVNSHLRFRTIRHSMPSLPIKISINGAGIEGSLNAFYRPSPVEQIKMTDLQLIVKKKEFSQQKALIIGGSRGLGESVAKIVAAGGGQSVITYNTGELDAQKVVDEINGSGGVARSFQLNIQHSLKNLEDLIKHEYPPTHVYYFSSPIIQSNRSSQFDRNLFDEFFSFYVLALDSICKVLADGPMIRLFYPSTIYLNEATPWYSEYICAKAAGEALCGYFAHRYSHISFIVERLPRMRTDQTNSFLEIKSADTHEVMLSVVRKMNS
ncbi:MAG: MaoC/PaaZ C-terminal domain-containing protein [Elusimicrobiota bacterium]